MLSCISDAMFCNGAAKHCIRRCDFSEGTVLSSPLQRPSFVGGEQGFQRSHCTPPSDGDSSSAVAVDVRRRSDLRLS